MIPISVNSIDGAVKAGGENFLRKQQEFRQGVQGLGKNLEKGILTARLYQEDADALEAQKLRAAIDGRDSAALEKLTRPGLLGRLFGNKEPEPQEDSGPALLGLTPAMQARRQEALNRRSLIAKAQGRLAEIENAPTARRAAERAGMATGYIPASEQDKMDQSAAMEREKMEALSLFRNQDKLMQAASQFNMRANGIRSSIGQIMGKPELTTEDKEYIKQQKADLKSQLAAYGKIRDKAIKEGIDPDFFAEFAELESGGDSFVPTDKLEELYVGTDFGTSDNLGLPNVKSKVKAAFPGYDFSLFTDGDWKKIQGYQHETADLARQNIIASNDVIKSGQSVKQGAQGITKGGQEIKQGDFAIKQSQFNSEHPNYSGLVSQKTENMSAAAKAVDLYRSGNYKGVVEMLGIALPESGKFGFKIPFVSTSFPANPTKEDAMKALRAFDESMKIIDSELDRANARKKEIGL